MKTSEQIALRNWSGHRAILATDTADLDTMPEGFVDTFYLEQCEREPKPLRGADYDALMESNAQRVDAWPEWKKGEKSEREPKP